MDNEEMLRKFSGAMREALQEIILRCEKSNIDYKWDKGLFQENDLIVCIPGGKNKREIDVYNLDDASKLLNSDFDKYVFVEGYEVAICSYVDGKVEATVDSIGPEINKPLILSRLAGMKYQEAVKDIKAGKDIRWEVVEGGSKGIRISIGGPSNTLLAMVNYIEEEDALSVRIEGLRVTKNSEAAEVLGRLTNSLFFEIRRKRKVNLFIERHYEIETSAWTTKSKRKSKEMPGVGFPKFEYDKEPSEMYWHAVSAYKMPLMQYLAYYQILEYYFPKYSMLGAKRDITNCLKDPEFNVDDDNDIVKIVACVSGKLGRSVDENSQLRDVIRACISEEDLVSEVISEPLKEYFRKEYKMVSQFRVSEDNRDKDTREQLADRIYDIRCKIVHTKEDDKRGRIMPFTKEAVLLLRFDLPLIGNLANKALISNSKNLSF